MRKQIGLALVVLGLIGLLGHRTWADAQVEIESHAYLYLPNSSQKEFVGPMIVVQQNDTVQFLFCDFMSQEYPKDSSGIEKYAKSDKCRNFKFIGNPGSGDSVGKTDAFVYQNKSDRYVAMLALIIAAKNANAKHTGTAFAAAVTIVFENQNKNTLTSTAAGVNFTDSENQRLDTLRVTSLRYSDAVISYPEIKEKPIVQ